MYALLHFLSFLFQESTVAICYTTSLLQCPCEGLCSNYSRNNVRCDLFVTNKWNASALNGNIIICITKYSQKGTKGVKNFVYNVWSALAWGKTWSTISLQQYFNISKTAKQSKVLKYIQNVNTGLLGACGTGSITFLHSGIYPNIILAHYTRKHLFFHQSFG